MMIDKDLRQYVSQTWQGTSFVKPLSEVSKPDSPNSALINRPEKVYCFDSICESIYPKNKPASVDGLFFCENSAYFVEFKTGFKKKITRKNYDEEKAMCPKYNHPCKDYGDLFFKNQDKETEGLKYAIKIKAIESYITLEKEILSCCEDAHKSEIVLIVVIDDDGIDSYEDTLLELSENHAALKAVDNIFSSLKKSLQGYKNKKDKHCPPNDYYYDKIEVLSAKEFERFFDELLPKMINPSNTEPQTV